jgi:threonylcarbamoyladenosine tRNA methylthiotransferase MtaB
MAEVFSDKISKIDGVDYICGNGHKLQVIEALEKLFLQGHKNASPEISISPLDEFEAMQIAKFDRTRAYIKIEDGCENRCTYCIIPEARGKVRSKSPADVLSEVRALTDGGCREIVLTGIDLASYVKPEDGKVYLISDLCKRLLKDVPGIRRLRLSSVDPAVPDIDNVIDLILSEPRMMPHLHLSMQSGADTILKSMGRRHNAQRIRDMVLRGRGKVTFSWDIICGFPGESEDLFRETLALVHETEPIKIHAFPFSPRPGTPAADMPNQIDRAVSKERVRIINNAASENRMAFMRSQIGKTVQVLMEENNVARCPHDIAVKINSCPIAPRTICDVKLIDVVDDYFIGIVI